MQSVEIPPPLHPMREIRLRRGVSQDRLAELAGLSQSRVSRLERGAAPENDEAQRIADALGVPVATLFPSDTSAPELSLIHI
jgi:transcriptional regulator with XRE-family HTH domain